MNPTQPNGPQPHAPASPAPPPGPPAPPHHKGHPGTIIVWIIALVVIVGFASWVLRRIYAPAPIAKTDDARVAVHYTSIAPRVAAPVVEVLVTDNQVVHKGDPIVRLDPTDYQVAVDAAEAVLIRDRSRIQDVAAALKKQPSLVTQEAARIPGIEARITFARQNLARYQNLADTGAGTVQSRQQSEAELKQGVAELDAAKASVQAAQRQLAVFQAEQTSTAEQVKVDEKALEQAKLNLEYTVVRAPMDGTIGQLSVQLGDYANVGSPLMSLVPLRDVFIESNYLETELNHVLPGQKVLIHLDTYNVDLQGVVDSIAPASGATYSAIPPENATGNFTKIVQRLTVKTRVLPNQPLANLLRVGMNVETSIDTKLVDVVAAQQRGGANAAPVTNR